MSRANPDLVADLRRHNEFDAAACMNCGACTAACPMGIDLLPRRLFRYALLGLEDRVREGAEAVFSCLLCRMCQASCPAGVNITENVRALRGYMNRKIYRV